ncbi:MAG: hypothetical protein DWQ40_00325 [Actinobacteria bacterium]|nr:MAG: hypothetical protein DWQ40_00325 [Actinomycetota bacterium]
MSDTHTVVNMTPLQLEQLRIATPQGRKYKTPVGDLPSVTSITKLMPGTALMWWAAGEAAKDAMTLERHHEVGDWLAEVIDATGDTAVPDGEDPLWKKIRSAHTRSSQKAADRGTEAHDMVERYILGDLDHVPDEGNPYFDEFLKAEALLKSRFLPGTFRWEFAEVAVYNPELGYAGTLDIGYSGLVPIEGGIEARLFGIADLKTRAKDNRAFPGAALQVWALANCPYAALTGPIHPRREDDTLDSVFTWKQPMPTFDEAFVIVANPDGGAMYEVPLSGPKAEALSGQFQSLLHTAWFEAQGDPFDGKVEL